MPTDYKRINFRAIAGCNGPDARASAQFDNIRFSASSSGVSNLLVYSEGLGGYIPEPATLSLLALGGLLVTRRRR